MRPLHPTLLALPLLCMGCGLTPLATDCVPVSEVIVGNEELVEGADFTAGEARKMLGNYRGSITWDAGAQEQAVFDLSSAGDPLAITYDDPESCPVAYRIGVTGVVTITEDARFVDDAATGSLRAEEPDYGRITMDVDLGDGIGGLRVPEGFDPASFDRAFIRFDLTQDSGTLSGRGTWFGELGGETTQASCCRLGVDRLD